MLVNVVLKCRLPMGRPRFRIRNVPARKVLYGSLEGAPPGTRPVKAGANVHGRSSNGQGLY